MARPLNRVPLSLGSVVLLAILVHGQGQAAPARPDLPRVPGTEVSSEFSWERTTNLTVDANTAVFGGTPFSITFSVTYHGLKMLEAPESVDLLIVRESPAAACGDPGDNIQTRAEVPPVVAFIDALPVPLTRQTNDGPDRIKSIVPFEVFQWMVGGETLEFEVFARRFVLTPAQMRVLQQVSADWAHPSSPSKAKD